MSDELIFEDDKMTIYLETILEQMFETGNRRTNPRLNKGVGDLLLQERTPSLKWQS